MPGINDKNGARRQFSERAAINAPLQGTAADIIKRAMIAIDKALLIPPPVGGRLGGGHSSEELSLKSPHPNPPPNGEGDIRMLLHVHDELVFEVKENALATAEPLIKNAMENAAQISVPLTVETGIGNNWGEAH